MQVVAGDLDALGVVGKAEADDRAARRRELEHVLFGDDLGERPVRRLLARAPSARERGSKSPSIRTAHDAGRRRPGLERRASRSAWASGPSSSLTRPGSNHVTAANGVLATGRDGGDVAVEVRSQYLAVDDDHLAVEVVERAEPKISVLG